MVMVLISVRNVGTNKPVITTMVITAITMVACIVAIAAIIKAVLY